MAINEETQVRAGHDFQLLDARISGADRTVFASARDRTTREFGISRRFKNFILIPRLAVRGARALAREKKSQIQLRHVPV